MVPLRAQVHSPKLQGYDHPSYKEGAVAYVDPRELWIVTEEERRETQKK